MVESYRLSSDVDPPYHPQSNGAAAMTLLRRYCDNAADAMLLLRRCCDAVKKLLLQIAQNKPSPNLPQPDSSLKLLLGN